MEVPTQVKAAIDSVARSRSVRAIRDKLKGTEPVQGADLAIEPTNQRSKRLQECVSSTYWNLRLGMFLMAVAFPFVVFFVGIDEKILLQDSISAYYWAPNAEKQTPVRVWFFGFLFAIGAILYLYKGFSRLEDLLLDAAAVFSFGIAIFPMPDPYCTGECPKSMIHYVCAFGMFACLAVVAWCCNDDTLKELHEDSRKKYKCIYRGFAIALVASPLIALITNCVSDLPKTYVAETFGILFFASYWIVKSIEMRKGNDAQRASTA